MAICIHVIESDDTLATQLTGTLEAFGATVVRATDGAEGIRAAIAERPALVLLGLMDDKGAGYALCSKLRRKARDFADADSFFNLPDSDDDEDEDDDSDDPRR